MAERCDLTAPRMCIYMAKAVNVWVGSSLMSWHTLRYFDEFSWVLYGAKYTSLLLRNILYGPSVAVVVAENDRKFKKLSKMVCHLRHISLYTMLLNLGQKETLKDLQDILKIGNWPVIFRRIWIRTCFFEAWGNNRCFKYWRECAFGEGEIGKNGD